MPCPRAFRPCPLVLALMAVLPAFAQQDQADPGSSTKLETVIVTSQRRLEPLQEVPVAVKAFSAKQIDNMGITSTQDFVNLTPNMSFDNSFTYGNSFVVLRGVTQINNADSPVAVVVDGVPQNNQKQLKMNLFDVERIEVLKGPQGALYGRNAIGGAINIETKPPGNRFEGFVGMELGNGGKRELSGGVSGALKEDVALFRIVGQTLRSDGLLQNTYLQHTIDGVDHDNSLRAKLLLRPTSDVQIDLRASTVDFKAGATWDSIVASGKPGDISLPAENMFGKTTGRTDDYSAKVEADFSIGTLTAITAYTKLRESYRGDLDFSNPSALPGGFLGLGFQAGQGQNLNVRMASQELRLTSKANQALRWIAGVYYLDTRRDLETRAFVDTDSSLAQFDDPAKVIIDNKESNHNKASAVFGQLDYDFRKDLTLSTALRYDRDQRQQTDEIHGGLREASYGKWQPKATLTYKLNRDELVYGTLSTGFRSGGFNAPGQADFKSETLTNAELGMKTMLLGDRLQLNAAVFASRSKNFQFFYVDVSKGAQVISNIDRVDLKGLDLDFRFLPVKGLEFDGGLGITDSTIKKDAAEPGAVGNHTPKNVPFKVNLGVQYTQAVAAGIDGSIRLDYEHRDKKYWHPDNANVSPALDLWGLRVGLHGARDKWSVALVGKNLANKRYYADYNAGKYGGLPYDLGSLATPRTYGIEAKLRFE